MERFVEAFAHKFPNGGWLHRIGIGNGITIWNLCHEIEIASALFTFLDDWTKMPNGMLTVFVDWTQKADCTIYNSRLVENCRGESRSAKLTHCCKQWECLFFHLNRFHTMLQPGWPRQKAHPIPWLHHKNLQKMSSSATRLTPGI